MSNKKIVYVLYFDETSMCLCTMASANIRYVKNALKTHDKTNGKTKETGFIYQNTIFINPQRQNVINATVTYVTNISVESF